MVTVGVVRVGRHRAGRSRFHWDLRVKRRLLPAGTYAVTLHAITEGSLLSLPSGPGARTLIVSRGGHVRVRPRSPTQLQGRIGLAASVFSAKDPRLQYWCGPLP